MPDSIPPIVFFYTTQCYMPMPFVDFQSRPQLWAIHVNLTCSPILLLSNEFGLTPGGPVWSTEESNEGRKSYWGGKEERRYIALYRLGDHISLPTKRGAGVIEGGWCRVCCGYEASVQGRTFGVMSRREVCRNDSLSYSERVVSDK